MSRWIPSSGRIIGRWRWFPISVMWSQWHRIFDRRRDTWSVMLKFIKINIPRFLLLLSIRLEKMSNALIPKAVVFFPRTINTQAAFYRMRIERMPFAFLEI